MDAGPAPVGQVFPLKVMISEAIGSWKSQSLSYSASSARLAASVSSACLAASASAALFASAAAWSFSALRRSYAF